MRNLAKAVETVLGHLPRPRRVHYAERPDEVRQEKVDPVPIHIPGNEAPLTIQEEIRRMVRAEADMLARQDNYESFDEADDFEINDNEPDLTSPYTVQYLEAEGDQHALDLDADGRFTDELPPEKEGTQPPPSAEQISENEDGSVQQIKE